MSDYISREAVLKIIEYAESMNWTDSEAEIQAETDYDFFREMIKAQPAVDVVEVKRGEWIELPSKGIGNTAECSICHDNVYGYNACKYCPNCGADMRGTSSEK